MLENVLTYYTTLLGVAAAVSVIINILKIAGVVKDGTAQLWVAGADLVVVLFIYAVQLFNLPIDLEVVNSIAGEAASVVTFILSFVVMLLASKGTYTATKGLPVIGKSNTPTQ